MALIGTLVYPFTSQDNTNWTGWGANVAISSGRLQVTTTASYFNLSTVATYDLRNSSMSIEIVQTPNLGNGTTSMYLTAFVSSSNSVSIFWEGGKLNASYKSGGVANTVQINYNATAHRIWRIREQSGILYWEASATGSSWSQLRAPISTPITVSAISAVLQSGYFGTEPSPGSAIFDNFNSSYSGAPGSTRTFYVDPTGSDSNNGLSPSTPWATISKVNTTALFPGDKVLFKEGSVWSGTTLAVSSSGSSGNPITFGSYTSGFGSGNDLPVISGGGSSGVAGSVNAAEVYGSYITFNRLDCRGGKTYDVYVNGTDFSFTYGACRWGSFGISQTPQAARMKVQNSTIADVNVGIIGAGSNDDAGGSGIVLQGDAADVSYNVIAGCVYTSPDYGLDGCAVEVYGATNATVHHNKASECVAFAELGNPSSNNNLYYNNVFSSSISNASGFVVHGTYYDDGVTLDPFGPVLGTKIHHNTVVLTSGNSAALGVWVSPGGQVDLRNNIIAVQGSSIIVSIGSSPSSYTEAANVFWGNGTANSNITLPSTMAATSTVSNPLFIGTNDFRLSTGSPAIDRGVNLSYTTDYAGTARPYGVKPDSGAYEWTTALLWGQIRVFVDWEKNGNFTGTYDEVTDDIRGPISVQFGRETTTSLSPIVGGRGSFTLDNSSRRYSPRYTGSPLYGYMKPARPVLITREVNVSGTVTVYTIFRGHTDDSPINPDPDSKEVQFNLVDSLSDFQQNTITTPLYQGIRTGTAIGYVLDAAGWTGGRDLDTGATIMPWWWADGESASDALQRILQSEGYPSLLTIGSSGEIIYRDRTHRKIRTASTTVQATMRGSGTTEPVMGRDFQYSDAWQNVVNSVTLSVEERQAQPVQQVWSSDENVDIPSGGSTTVQVKNSDPFYSAVVPEVGTDFQVISGVAPVVSLSRTSGASTAITFTSSSGPCTISNVQLRARPVPVVRSWQVTASDSTSISDYGPRGIPSNSEPEWAGRWDATGIANMFIAQRSQPLPTVQAAFPCNHTQTTRLTALLSLDLSDRVTVIEPETGLSNNFFVETIAHEINDVTDHVITVGLEMVPAVPASVFIIGTSVVGGTDTLGY